MENISKEFYIAITSAIALLVVNININLYKLKIKDFILMTIGIIGGCIILRRVNVRIASIFIYLLPVVFLYKNSGNFIKSILLNSLDIIIIVVTDSIISIIAINWLKIDIDAYTPKHILLSCIIFITLYFISKSIDKTIKKYNTSEIYSYKNKYIGLISLTMIATVIMFYFNINWNSNDNPIYLAKVNGITFIVYSLVLVLVCSILFMSIRKEADFKAKQIQFENLEEYTNKLEELYMDMRKFRHDYINIISSMGGFFEENDTEGLEQYFNKNIYPLNKQMSSNNYKLGLLKNIKIPAIKGVLSAKAIRAQELGLDVIIEVTEPIDNINMDIIDFSRCFGIVLDNAIESALDSESKAVNIAFIKKKESVVLVIANGYAGEVPSIPKLFKVGFSTKGPNRGLGLSNLNETLNKYGNIYLDTYIKDDNFYQEITIGNKK